MLGDVPIDYVHIWQCDLLPQGMLLRRAIMKMVRRMLAAALTKWKAPQPLHCLQTAHTHLQIDPAHSLLCLSPVQWSPVQ